MSILGENHIDDFAAAGFVDDIYLQQPRKRGVFKGLNITVNIDVIAPNKAIVALIWRDVKLNKQTKYVYPDKNHTLFELAREAVLDFSDGCLDICKLNID